MLEIFPLVKKIVALILAYLASCIYTSNENKIKLKNFPFFHVVLPSPCISLLVYVEKLIDLFECICICVPHLHFHTNRESEYVYGIVYVS